MLSELMQVIEQVGKEKGLKKEQLLEALKAAVLSASKKHFGASDTMEAEINFETGNILVYTPKQVVAEAVNKKIEIELETAKEYNPEAQLGDIIKIPVNTEHLGRIAAQTAKQVIVQRVREAEREIVYNDFIGKAEDIITGIVQRIEKSGIMVELGKAEGIIPPKEQSFREVFQRGERIKVYVLEVRKHAKGPQVVLSRTHPGLLMRLFELEVPEIHEGIVEIKGAVREPNGRSKIAVVSRDKNVDPVGACVGMRGTRVQTVVQELKGEKIDIIQWDPDPVNFVTNALKPAKIYKVNVNEKERTMLIIAPDDQLSLAIGKKGQNVRLASKLTQWRIDIKSESDYKEEQRKKLQDIASARNLLAQSLAQFPGIGPKTVKLLLEEGTIPSMEKLAQAPMEKLMKIPGLGQKTAEKIIAAAQDFLKNKIRPKDELHASEKEEVNT